MFNWNLLAVVYTGLVGKVDNGDIARSFELMGKGMLGIFIVMLLIFLVIVVLNKTTAEKKGGK